MTITPLFKPLGINLLLLTACFLICAIVGHFCFNENYIAWLYPVSIALIAAIICFYKNIDQKKDAIFQRQLLLTTGLSWLLAVLIGCIPFISVSNLPICDAIFEAASGLTTTGSTVLANIDDTHKSILLWRALSQWLGGLGFVVFFVTLVGETTSSNKKLYLQEASTVDESVSLFDLRKQMLMSLLLYISLTVLCGLSLFLSGMTYFDAICHSLSTISTGGFSTHSAGIQYFNSAKIEWILIIFMFLGGTNFYLILKALRKKTIKALKNTEFLTYLCGTLLLSAIIAFKLCDNLHYSAKDSIRAALFQVISIATSTGFHSDDFALWPQSLIPLILAIMFVGGCTGSTSGGFKIFRVIAIAKTFKTHLEKIFRSNIIRSLKIDNTVWSEKMQLQLLNFLTITIFAITVSTMLISAFDPEINLTTLISSILSAVSNIGPGLDSVGPTQTFQLFSQPSKLILSALMLFGRLEFYAIIVLLFPKFWKTFD